MKKTILNHRDTKEENNLFKKKSKKSIFYRIKSVVELPDIWKKVNQYETKSTTVNDENIYFSLSNQNKNLIEKVTFKDDKTKPKFRIGAGEPSIVNNKHIKTSLNQDTLKRYLLDTGVIGGFEYWDGNFIDLPN